MTLWLCTGFGLVIRFTGLLNKISITHRLVFPVTSSLRCWVTSSNGGRSSVHGLTSSGAGDLTTPTSYSSNWGLNSPVHKIFAGPRRHSRSWFRVPSGPMALFLFFSEFYGFCNTTSDSAITGVWILLVTLLLLGRDSAGSNCHSHSHNHSLLKVDGRLYCCWPSPAQSFLVSLSSRSITKIFILS
jgi:hypothetical protein